MQPVPVLQTYVASFEEPCLADSNTSTHQVVGNIEWLGLEGTPRIITFHFPAAGGATNLHIWHSPRLPRAPSNLVIEHLQGWGIHSLSGQLFQHLTALSVKNFSLISNLNLPSLSLKPFPLVLSLSTRVKS